MALSPRFAGGREMSLSHRLGDRRYVVTGTRGYVVGTQAGRFPAMGFHTRGEMGGIWSPPMKLLDGIWFGIDDQWIRPAERFTSGYGYSRMALPSPRDGLRIKRVDFLPDGERAALFGLRFTAPKERQRFVLSVEAQSELMKAYPWGETNPSQLDYNLPDEGKVLENGRILFRERGTPPVPNAGVARRLEGSRRGQPEVHRCNHGGRFPGSPGTAGHLSRFRPGRAPGAVSLRRHGVRARNRRTAPLPGHGWSGTNLHSLGGRRRVGEGNARGSKPLSTECWNIQRPCSRAKSKLALF